MTVQGHGWDDYVGYPLYRNVIINGAMSVAQRSSSIPSITGGNYYTADRWAAVVTTLGTWTQSVENDAPTGSGFRKSLKMLCTTADASPAANDIVVIRQGIEAQNLQHFKKGTADAESWALSFWVKANLTGTYITYLNHDPGLRTVSASYTITAVNTWEKKTIIFPADTSGVITNDNALGVWLNFGLGAGSTFNPVGGTLNTVWNASNNATVMPGQVNLAASVNNYWQVTGVQLEPVIVTPFEFEPFETTLRKCQRYYQQYSNFTLKGVAVGPTTVSRGACILPVVLRTAPTSYSWTGAAFWNGASGGTYSSVIANYSTNAVIEFELATTGAAWTSGQAVVQYQNSSTQWFSSEL